MSEPKVVTLHPVTGGPFNPKDIKTLDGRYRCLVRMRGYLLTTVLCQTKLSPSREYIELGGFFSSQASGWFPISEIEILEILAKVAIEDGKPPRPRWWKFWKR